MTCNETNDGAHPGADQRTGNDSWLRGLLIPIHIVGYGETDAGADRGASYSTQQGASPPFAVLFNLRAPGGNQGYPGGNGSQ
jgi:hypothetical protein